MPQQQGNSKGMARQWQGNRRQPQAPLLKVWPLIYVAPLPHGRISCPQLRRQLIRLVEWPKFDSLVMLCIVVNVVLLSMNHYHQPNGLAQFLSFSNAALTILFALEAAVKIIAMRPTFYWQCPWNRFDFAITALSVFGLMMMIFGVSGTLGSIIRTLRVCRIFRLVKKAHGLRRLIGTLMYSLPALYNIGSLLLGLFFSFSILGMSLWGAIPQDGVNFHNNANFETFPVAFLTLYRVATTDNWPMIFTACARSKGPWCDEGDAGCDSTVAASIYFITFIVSASFLLMNMFIGVILESLSDIDQQMNMDGQVPLLFPSSSKRFTFCATVIARPVFLPPGTQPGHCSTPPPPGVSLPHQGTVSGLVTPTTFLMPRCIADSAPRSRNAVCSRSGSPFRLSLQFASSLLPAPLKSCAFGWVQSGSSWEGAV